MFDTSQIADGDCPLVTLVWRVGSLAPEVATYRIVPETSSCGLRPFQHKRIAHSRNWKKKQQNRWQRICFPCTDKFSLNTEFTAKDSCPLGVANVYFQGAIPHFKKQRDWNHKYSIFSVGLWFAVHYCWECNNQLTAEMKILDMITAEYFYGQVNTWKKNAIKFQGRFICEDCMY